MTYKDISSKEANSSIYDDNAIYESVKNIIFTRPGELPGLPEFGTNIQDLLFEQMNFEMKVIISSELDYAISRWEERIILEDVEVTLDDDYNRILIKIEYKLNNEHKDEYNAKFMSFKVNRNS